jgi:hypothetical protein
VTRNLVLFLIAQVLPVKLLHGQFILILCQVPPLPQVVIRYQLPGSTYM